MLEYIRAKVVDYAIILSWIEQELQDIELRRPEHHSLIVRLQSELAETKDLHNYLIELVKADDGSVLSLIPVFESFIVLATSYYLPALQKEGEADRFLRQLLLAAMKQCGLNWIEDIVVQLDGQHATFSRLSAETPLILAPPQHAVSFLDMPGLYHEFGHNVSRKLPRIVDILTVAVSEHFADLLRNADSLISKIRDERNLAINNALEYWNIERQNELFCDIFATFVCGPAHYISCIDMALRSDRDSFHVDDEDVHPPFSARVYACYKSLNLIYSHEPIVVMAQNAWKGYEDMQRRNGEFDLICSETLLDCLVGTAIRCIRELLPGAKYYSTPLPCDEELEHIPEEMSLADILNRGAKILFTYPERYADWEKKTFKKIKSLYRLDLNI